MRGGDIRRMCPAILLLITITAGDAAFGLKAFASGGKALTFDNKVPANPPGDAPDILIIMADQMRGDGLSAAGHPVVNTPNMDALANNGALFRRAYSTVPSCTPARYAMLTGMSPQKSGVVGYAGTHITRVTMPQLFRDAGYLTALVGRTMHQRNPDKDLGYEQVLQGSVYPDRHEDYNRYLKEKLPPGTPLGKILHEDGLRSLVEAMGVSYNHWQAEPWPLNDTWHPTNWIARESQQIVNETPAGRPLFLTASFYVPHSPLFPAGRFLNAYMDKDLPEAAFGDWVDPDALSPPAFPLPQESHGGSRVLLEGETLRRAQSGYFGLIEHLDEAIAPLIATFKGRSERAGRPWVILVLSEHGEMLGDHGYFRKCEPYEGSANIPFIIAASDGAGLQRGMRSYRPVGMEDVFPTLAEMAGISTPEEADGVSLVPHLKGEDQEVRPWLHLEHSPIYSDEQGFQALTDGRYKYIWRPANGKEQLFDLENDPREERNLAADPDYAEQLIHWRNRLVRHLASRPEGFSDGDRLISGRNYEPVQPGKSP